MKKLNKKAILFISMLLFLYSAEALPPGWNNSQPIQIQNNVAVSVIDYQVQLTVNTQALIALGQMNANGSDIRFGKDCSGNVLFNYWIESGINTPNTIIWVKMDSLNSLETRTMYMFYNNPAAPAVSAVNGTFFGPNSSTDSVASGGAGAGVANCQRGFRFSPLQNLLITSFGKRVPDATTRYVTLFNFATQAIMAQMQVAGPAAQYSYGALPNPIWLTQGTQYLIEVFQAAGDGGYYFGTSSQIGQHLTYYDMKYCNACTQNTFPTSTLTNYHYGYPDFWYYTKTNLATAPTVTFGAGGGGVTFSATPSSICIGGSSVLSGVGGATYNWQPGNFNGNPYNVTPAATTIYTVTATTANGCTVTSTLMVTLNPINTGTGSASPDPICLGNSTTITASAITSCAGNVNDFAGIYAPANWTYGTINSNGTVNTAGAPANIIISSGTNLNGNPGTTMYTKNMTCSGNITFNWAYTNADAFGSIFDYPRYTINGGAPVVMPGFVIGGSNSQNGAVVIPLNSGDVFQFHMYTIDNDPTPGYLTITNFTAPATAVTGTVSIWDSPTGGINLGGSPQTVTPLTAGTVNYYVEITSNGPGNCVNPARVAVPVTVNTFANIIASASPPSICTGGSTTLSGANGVSYIWDPGALVGSPTVSPVATTTYTVTGTDAGGCTATSTVEVVVNALPTITATPATQTVCEMGMATVSGGGGVSYVWTGGINDATPFMVMAPAVYTVTGTDAGGCTGTATAEVLMNPAPLVSASATPNTTCNTTSVIPNGTGPNLSWSGGLLNGVPFIAMATNTYTVTGTDGNGCTATSTVTVNVTAASGTLAPATSNQSQTHDDDFNISYYDASCNLISSVDDGAGGNILGLTTATVNVDAVAGTHNGQPYVRRWYQITPTNNGSADVVLYINQSDFDDYNAAVVAPYLPLPTTGNNADPNIANIRITKNDDAGLGNNPIVITPTVNWNGTYWELSFNTPSFSQFRVHGVNPGNVPLPATVTNFSGTKLEASDKLSWTTSSEQNNAYFNLQHSTDGINFSTLAKVNSKAPNGTSATALNYSSINNKPALGHNYYRLQQVDIDNKVNVHTQIVDLIWGANGSTVSIYPNPATDILNIDLYSTKTQNTTVKLLDVSGRVIKQIQAKSVIGMNNIKLNMNDIVSGVYTVQIYENNTLTHTDKVKKND